MILLLNFVAVWGYIMDCERLSIGWCSHHFVPAGSCHFLHYPQALSGATVDYHRELRVW